MKEEDLGSTPTIEFDEQHIVIGLSRKFLKLNDGKPIEFRGKIDKEGRLVLESQVLTKLSNTGVDDFVKH
ncbi:MAG: hypothetical protein ACREBB_11050 [Nitrosotalea sp.]